MKIEIEHFGKLFTADTNIECRSFDETDIDDIVEIVAGLLVLAGFQRETVMDGMHQYLILNKFINDIPAED